MRHLDEGTLQAWLDRPRSGLDPEEETRIEDHLVSCDECAKLLEALEDSTARVEALLVDGAAAEAMPAWDAVRARARSDRSDGRRRRAATAVAWAASVTVALGVGWMANEMGRADAGSRAGVEAGADAASSVDRVVAEAEPAADLPARPGAPVVHPDSTGTPRPGAVSEEAPVLAEAAEDAPAEQVGTGLPTTLADASASDVVAGPDTAPPQDVAAKTAPAAGERAARPSRGLAAPAPPELREPPERSLTDVFARQRRGSGALVEGRVTDETGRPLSSVQLVAEGTGRGTLSGPDGTFALWLDRPPADTAAWNVTLTATLIGYGEVSRDLTLADADAALSTDLRMAPSAVSLEEIVVTGAARQAPEPEADRAREDVAAPVALPVTSWRTVSRDEARDAAGFEPLAVEGLRVIGIAAGTDGVVRVTQDLGNGGRLELVQVLGADPVVPGPVPEGASRVSARRGEVSIVATAPLQPAELEALLDRLR